MRVRAIVVTYLAVLMAGVQYRASNQAAAAQETFRTSVDVVRLDVTVLDRNRQPIRDLRAEDFSVLEDGKPQPVVAFAAVDAPAPPLVTADWMREVSSDVVTNQLDLRRIIVIIMDDATASPDHGVPRAARQIARAVVDQLGPNDLAAVVFTLDHRSQNFTDDRRQLIAAIESFAPKSTSAPSRWSAANPTGGTSSVFTTPLACRDSCLTVTLKNVAAALEQTAIGRKTIVLISSGAPSFSIQNLQAPGELRDLQQVFRSFQQANVNVYPFDPRGLTSDGIVSEKVDSLRVLAENTGGRATVGTNVPWQHVAQVFAENSSYYLLGVLPEANSPNGFRRITVKVARPDVEVRVRAGYFAARGVARAPATDAASVDRLDRALRAGLPSGTLPLQVSVAPFAARNGKQAVVVVTTSVRRPVTSTHTTERWKIHTAAFDPSSLKERAAQRQSIEAALRPNATGERRFEIQSRLALRPGRYEIRSAAEVPSAAGGVLTQVEIPDFAKARLSLSGLVLGFARTGDQDRLAELLPIVPTTIRAFPHSSRVAAFLRVYQGGDGPLLPVRMRLRIVDARMHAAIEESMTLEPSKFGARRAADCAFQLPLSKLLEGEYLLSLGASADKLTALREVRFRIEDR